MDVCNEDEVIESSQTPMLRSKVREKKINYYETDMRSSKESKSKARKRARNSSTVSQCLREEWKTHHGKTRAAPKPASQEEEYFKCSTQRDSDKGVPVDQSVDLFKHKENLVANYLHCQNAEKEQEIQLQKMMDECRANHDQARARMTSTPISTEHIVVAPSFIVLSASIEPLQLEGNENRTVNPPPPDIVQSFIMPNFSEEIARLERETGIRTSQPDEMKRKVPSFVVSDMIAKDVSVPLFEACLDLSVRTQVAANDEGLKHPQQILTYLPNTIPPEPHEDDPANVLDLRKVHSIADRCPARASLSVPQKSPQGSRDAGTQTKSYRRFRNAGVQHRPVASFDFTERNIITLAQAVEMDPALLHIRLKQIAKSSSESIWQVRDLSKAFSHADPYFANLHHFL